MGQEAEIDTEFVYDVEARFAVDLEVTILRRTLSPGMLESAVSIPSRMINFSRSGFCLATVQDLPPGTALSLELRGWPPIDAHVAWSRNGRAGCQLVAPLDDQRFDAMLLSVDAIDRSGDWNL